MKYWLDTEFLEDGHTIRLISIALVAEDGRELYAVNADYQSLCAQNDWLMVNVLPHLFLNAPPGSVRTLPAIRDAVQAFIGKGRPELWAYYADYDWVAFCWLFGAMIDLPRGWPKYCRDIKQLADMLGVRDLPAQAGTAHNALEDARWARDAWRYLDNYQEGWQRLAARHGISTPSDREAIRRWQEATGRPTTWPDHADLCQLLLKENAQLQAHVRTLANQSALFRAELEKEQRRKAAWGQAQIDAERDTNARLTDLLEKAEAEIARLRQARAARPAPAEMPDAARSGE